jgi:outer membrane receptor protein involved in Fe transport
MKKIVLIISAIILSVSGFAQMPGGMPGGGAKAGRANIGRVYGKLTDADGKAVSGASVMVMQKNVDSVTKKPKEILYKAMITESNGEFNFEELPIAGSLKLTITSTGFKAINQPISFFDKMVPGAPKPAASTMPSFNKDLGNIQLAADAKQLQDVTITAPTSSSVKLYADKKIFNVEKNIMSAGGTAVDVMRNVPSVNVDIDGNISIRNQAPQLLIDGRPTTLTLEQIPADAIESVEVITNPSAKYDASGGGAGILNIVLKKNKKTGYNGNARAGVDKYGALNGGGDFSFRQNKVNFTMSVNGSQNKGVTTSTTDRMNLDSPQTSVNQNGYSKSNGGFLFGKFGLDYFVTNRTTLSLTGIRVHGNFGNNETIDILTDSLTNAQKGSYASERITNSDREFNGQGLVFGMKHIFPKEGEELTVDANFFGGKMTNNSFYTTNFFDTDNTTIINTDLQKAIGTGTSKNIVVQTDYVKPFSKLTKFETGLRVAASSRENLNDYYNYIDSAYALMPNATSNYTNSDNVYAAYATISSSVKDFNYKVGLRAESSDYKGTLTNTGESYGNNYPISLFPSVFLTQQLANKQQVQLSYSRRINRPNFFQLIPYVNFTDPLNITRGNPNLVPEFTQSLELSYLKTFKGNNTVLGSVYYKYTNGLITRYLIPGENPVTGQPVLINTYINANSSYQAGAELTVQNYLKKWWDISTNVNVYNSKVNTGGITNYEQPALWSMFAKFNSNFKLPAEFAIQLSAIYQSKTNLPVSNNNFGMGGPHMGGSQSSSQGYILPSWGVDIAVKKSFLKNNAASVSLSATDIFKTRLSAQYSSSEYFTQSDDRWRDPPQFRLNLAYRFGKIDATLFKRKTSKGEMNATEGVQ